MNANTASQAACHADNAVYHMLPNYFSPTCANAWELPDETARSFLPELAVADALACGNQGMICTGFASFRLANAQKGTCSAEVMDFLQLATCTWATAFVAPLFAEACAEAKAEVQKEVGTWNCKRAALEQPA